MGQTLTNGIYLPNEGERNCYSGLAANWNAVDTLKGNYSLHAINVDIHVTSAEKETWNGKADASALTAHTGNTTIHVTSADKEAWNGKADNSALTAHTGDTTIHVTSEDKEAWNSKADASALTAHTGDTTIHVTAEDKAKWDAVTSKADSSALTAHTGDTTIHVTAEDKQAWNGHVADSVKHVTAEDKAKWDAVTTKANDDDVVHLTGNERSSGNKTFEGEIISNSSILISNGSDFVTGTKDKRLTDKNNFNILNERITYNNLRNVRYTWTIYNKNADGNLISSGVQLAISPTGQAYFYPLNDNDILFGASTAYIRGIYTKLINNINPGALSMPASSGSVDISGYITDLSGGNNTYTPPVNGFVYIDLQNTDNLTLATGGLSKRHYLANSTFTRIADYIHVRAGVQVVIICSGTLKAAAFIPCQGNT